MKTIPDPLSVFLIDKTLNLRTPENQCYHTRQVTMPYDIEVTVKDVKGKCSFGYKIGDKIQFDGKAVKGATCYSALMTILPKVYAMRYGAEFPWTKNKDIIVNACPDPENPVLFEIRRIRK